MCANGSSRAPNLLRVRLTPLATARTKPWSRVSRVTIRSASPSLCWRSTTARSRYRRIRSVSHRVLTRPVSSAGIFSTLMAVPPVHPASSAPKSPLPTLTGLLYRLASGSVTSVELVGQSLDAIEASQPTLNAFRVVLRRQALADAARADRRRAAGQHAPLLGIPIAVKDDVDVEGVPTMFGAAGRGRAAAGRGGRPGEA